MVINKSKKMICMILATIIAISSIVTGRIMTRAATEKGILTDFGMPGNVLLSSFGATSSTTLSYFAIKVGSDYYVSYCGDFWHSPVMNADITEHEYTREEKINLNRVLTFGFSKKVTSGNMSNWTSKEKDAYWATQCAVWSITEGDWDSKTKVTSHINSMASQLAIDESYCKEYFWEIYNNTKVL